MGIVTLTVDLSKNMKFLGVASALGLAASATVNQDWQSFKAKFGKNYANAAEESRRFAIFKENAAFIARHNADHKIGKESYTVGVNQFADLTNAEFRVSHLAEMVEAPQIRLNYYDMACNGGWIDNALYYVMQTGYIDGYDNYPYVSGSTKQAGNCVADPANSVGKISNCGATTKNSESELTSALAQVGAMGIAIDAGGIGFQLYSGGVYVSNTCSSSRLNHAVTAVGYGNLDGQDYFTVKNSWGTVWGDQGYILMAANRNNQCGVAATPAYAIA